MNLRFIARLSIYVFIACLLAAVPAVAQTEPYYNIVSVASKQMSNCVRVTIEADGAISANVNKWWNGGEDSDYYLDWEEVNKQTSGQWSPDCYPKVDTIKVHLSNAIPQVGNVVAIAKYPVSHVKFVTAPNGAKFGVDLEVTLYKPMRLRALELTNASVMGWDAYLYDHHDPAWFEVIQSPDSRSLIITVASDRIPDVSQHLKLSDIPESQRMLSVKASNGLLDISARNASLSSLVAAVAQATGRQMSVEPAADRVVTAELPSVSLTEFISYISKGYGLIAGEVSNRIVFCDPSGASAVSQVFVRNEKIPVKWMPASRAINLLPALLLGSVRVDSGSNSLMVSGAAELVEKVRADLEKIDLPEPQVLIEAVVVECLAGTDLLTEVDSSYTNDRMAVSASAALGELSYSTLGGSQEEIATRIQALEAVQKAKTVGRSSIVVASGETGEIFVGVDKYISFRRTVWTQDVSVEPVSAGIRLLAVPRAGSKAVSMEVTTEAKEVGDVDPVTHMPTINARSAKGSLNLASGSTILIGGLTQRQQSRIVRKIPILGDLPIVGALFRKRIRSTSENQLAVLLTPTVLPAGTQTALARSANDGEGIHVQ